MLCLLGTSSRSSRFRPGCYPSIGMAADATFPCRATDLRALLASVSNQRSSAARSVVPAKSSLVARSGSIPNVISRCRDPHLRPSHPSGSHRRPHSTIVCHPQPSYSKYQTEVPEALSHVLLESPIASKTEMPRKTGAMHLAFAAAMPSHALNHPRKVVVHHKHSRPSLRNPQPQLLINRAPPRV